MSHESGGQSTTDPRVLLEDYQWLIGPEAEELLSIAADWLQPTAAQVTSLRKQCTASRAHLVLEQVALRSRAQAKFAAAARMFFTPVLLEQATDEVVARYKAQRFAGRGRVFDLCCGIGGDLLALAAQGEVVGFDRDPVAALLACANARAVHGAAADVQVRDAREVDTAGCGAWHVDPDRRPKGFRTTHVDLHEPGSEVIDRLLAQDPNAAVKLAPAARMSESWVEQAELEWISRDRQCRQSVAWFGGLAREPGRRRATVLHDAASLPRTILGVDEADPPVARRIASYVFEPDAAVLAAGLGGALAAEHRLQAIAPRVAYWTGQRPIDDPALGCFEVLEVLPLHVKQLKGLLRARDIGRLEIKKRGVEGDPAALRRQLDLKGQHEATLLVTRIGRRATAILARRVS